MANKADSLGDRMKHYEAVTSSAYLIPLLPVVIRVDGRSFHQFTKGMERPYDKNLMALMGQVTQYITEQTNAVLGYTQSDEINLILYSDSYRSKTFFEGRLFKLISMVASIVSVKFNQLLPEYFPEKTNLLPIFDCRVFNLPSLEEASNYLIWREQDALRNSIQMAARANFSHKQCHLKNQFELQEMLLSEKQINWNDYPVRCRRGSYFKKIQKMRTFSARELERLPEKHEARKNPDLEILRSRVEPVEFPPLTQLDDRIKTLFL